MPAKTPGSRRSESSLPFLGPLIFIEDRFERNSAASLAIGSGSRNEPIEPSNGQIRSDLAVPSVIG